MIIVGFILGAALVALCLWLTIRSYLKKMRSNRRHGLVPLNIGYIISAFILVIIIHILCVQGADWVLNGFFHSFKDLNSFLNSFRTGIGEIYNQLGGLTFEGQDFDNTEHWAVIIFATIYFASILYLSVTFATLIVIGVVYQIYSRVMLFKAKHNKNLKHIYIFTYATRESLALAEDIVKNPSKDGDYIIIFASDELGPYDKDNDIHYRISQSNYLYIPLSRNNEQEHHNLLEKLFGKAASGSNYLNFIQNHEISIFALETNNNEKGDESKNSDMIFDDIKDSMDAIKDTSLDKLHQLFKDTHLRINYFILSHHDLNFEYYEKNLIGLFEETYQKSGLVWKDIPPIFNLSVLNEAIMSAEDLVNKRHANLDEDKASFKKEDGYTFINQLDGGHRSLVVGFGQNGQMALGHLFSDTLGGVMEGDMFIPNQFSAEVLDKKIDDVIASFKATHPSFVFKKGEYVKNLPLTDGCYDYLRNRYSRFANEFDKLNRYMAFPRIFYRKENYNSGEFINTIDKIVKREYDSVIVALGDDERNIECANAILMALRQSKVDESKKLQIFVNIRDYNNNKRLAWNEDFDSKVIKNVFVYPFGNARDIYSKSLLDFSGGAKIHRTYDEINGTIDDKYTDADWEGIFLKNCNLFERKTNFAAYNYQEVYKQFLDASNSENLIKESHNQYQKAKGNVTKINYKNASGEDKEVAYFNLEVKKPFFENIKSIETSSRCDDKLKVSLANFERIKMCKGKDTYLKKDTAGYYWRYLIQFDHMRWCRHLMMYGRTYTDKFEPSVYDNPNDSNKNEKYWKNTLLLHDCLLPYSSFTDFSKAPKANYLAYHEEDYDYGVIVGALDLENKL